MFSVSVYLYNVLQLEKGPMHSFSGCRIESFFVKVRLEALLFVSALSPFVMQIDFLHAYVFIWLCNYSRLLALMLPTYSVVLVMETPTFGRLELVFSLGAYWYCSWLEDDFIGHLNPGKQASRRSGNIEKPWRRSYSSWLVFFSTRMLLVNMTFISWQWFNIL